MASPLWARVLTCTEKIRDQLHRLGMRNKRGNARHRVGCLGTVLQWWGAPACLWVPLRQPPNPGAHGEGLPLHRGDRQGVFQRTGPSYSHRQPLAPSQGPTCRFAGTCHPPSPTSSPCGGGRACYRGLWGRALLSPCGGPGRTPSGQLGCGGRSGLRGQALGHTEVVCIPSLLLTGSPL